MNTNIYVRLHKEKVLSITNEKGASVMYFLVKARLRIPVRPSEIKPEEDIDTTILKILRNELEGTVQEEYGYIIAVIDAFADEIGDILHGSPNIFFNVTTTMLVYKPFYSEIIEGEIVDVTQQALYVNLGCVDAYLPTSQLWHDKFRFDAKERILKAQKTKIVIRKGDYIRARVSNVEYRVPEILRPLVRGTIVKPAVEIRPKSEIRILLRAGDTGLGLLRILEQTREEVLKSVIKS